MQTAPAVGRQATYALRDTNAPPPRGRNGGAARWADSDVLLVRVPLDATVPAAYVCPCTTAGCGSSCSDDAQCTAGPCCTDAACADTNLGFYYVEFSRFPVPGDYGTAATSGISIRMAGGLRACASTRLVATHLVNGLPRYALDSPDPAGKLPGSYFEDPVRRVIVRLDGMGPDWAQVSVLRY